jgi:segregation and condensation protein B
MEHELDAILESILFAAGDPVTLERLAAVTGAEEEEILAAALRLRDGYAYERRGVRLLQLEDSLQLCSAPENGEYVRRALETRKPPKLSAAAMEVLTLVAYFQPVTRTYIEQIRGVDSSYTVGLLTERELIEPCGRLDVPGRPVLYRTTPGFLRAFGLKSLEELPELEELPGALEPPEAAEKVDSQ